MHKKTQAWKEACVDYICGAGNTGQYGFNNPRTSEMQTYYDLYNSIYDEKDLKYVTNPFKQNDGFPATAKDYNIIKPYVDQLLGEETKRPFNFQVCRTSDDAASELQEEAKQLLIDYIMASIMSKLSPEQAQQYQQQMESGEIMPPDQIQKYMQRDHKDVAESCAYHSLEYLKRQLNISHEFYKGWKDALIGGEEWYYVGILNGSPCLERVNPMFFDYEKSADLEFIHDASWCVRLMIMSATEIYDRFYDKMTEKQLNELLDLIDQKPGAGMSPQLGKSSLDYNHVKMQKISSFSDNPFDTDHISVYHCCWKSFKKIGFVSILNPETEQIEEFQVDEDYKVTGTEESVEWRWIVEVWEGYRIGDDLYIGIQPLEYQHVSADNPNSQRLPYTGVVYNNTNSKPRSLVSMMKPLQYMYIVIWYRLELAMSRDKGKVPVIDVTQIPKSMDIDVNKWMHYLSALGVAFINPYECFDPETLVLMADGCLKKIKDISVNEEVMGPDGKPRRVLARHTGIDHMYELKALTGGENQIVNSKHQIYYKQKDYHKKTEYTKLQSPVDLLKETQHRKYISNLRYLQRVKDILPERYTNDQLLIDPYILGLWLGDGFVKKPAIITQDSEIVQAVSQYVNDNNLQLNVSTQDNTLLLNMIASRKRYGNKPKNPFIQALKYYHIFDRKDIPEQYIYTTKENKLRLLAGLIDTDGYFSKRDNYYIFSQCESRKHIVDKAAFIARSLGFKCTVTKYNDYYTKQILGQNKPSKCEPTWVLSILDGNDVIPCKVARKQGSVQKIKGNPLQSNFKVEYKGIGEYCGITVDGDNLFVLGDFTIVHNCGWDVPGREGGRPAQFNQFQAWDLSMANVIDQYINLMAKIEDMVAKLTGITPQRQGSIAASELVGNTTQAITQSYHITEPWFWMHNQVKQQALRMLLDTAKVAWKNNKRFLHYILDDGTRAFINLSDQFFYEDFDVFVTDSTRNRQDLDALRQLMQPAMQNGASLLDIAEIITMDNINAIKDRLADIEQKRMEQMQQQQQAEQEVQQRMLEEQNRVKEEELMLKEAELELEKYKIDTDSQTKITVAQLNAYRGVENMDQDANGIPDVLEIASQALAERKQMADESAKQMEINAKIKDSENKKQIENKKMQLERDRMKHETELQKMSDKAAMEREKLKARTALRNKTTGEK